MMQTFQEENRSARKRSGLRRADPPPELATSIPFTAQGFTSVGEGRFRFVWPPAAWRSPVANARPHALCFFTALGRAQGF